MKAPTFPVGSLNSKSHFVVTLNREMQSWIDGSCLFRISKRKRFNRGRINASHSAWMVCRDCGYTLEISLLILIV